MATTNTITNTTTTTATVKAPFDYKVMSTDNLARLGLVKVTSNSGKRAISDLRKDGGFIFESDDTRDSVNAVAIAALELSKNVKAADSRMKDAAMLAGYIAKSNAHLLLHDKKGRPYKSVNQLFTDLLPNINRSTISRLIDAGTLVYIPAIAGELPKEVRYIADMSPSSIKSLLPLLKDSDKKEDTYKAIAAAKVEAGKSGSMVSARMLESAAKSVRDGDKDGDKDSAPNTDSNESAADIAAQLSGSLVLPMVKKYVNAAVMNDELCMNVPEQHVAAFVELLSRGIDDAVTANQIIGALYDIANTALKDKSV